MSEVSEKPVRKRRFYQKKRFIFPVVIILAFAFLSIFGALYSSSYIKTSDAYIDEHIIQITPKISAKILELNLENNSPVKKGEIVVELDGTKYFEEVKRLEKEFFETQKALKTFEYEIDKMNTTSKQASEEIKQAKVNLENANDDHVRYKNAFKDGTVTKKDLANAVKNLELAQEQYENAQKNLSSISKALDEIIEKKDEQLEDLKDIAQRLDEAKIELLSATIVSNKNGKIINLNSKVGDVVSIEKPLFSIIPEEYYVIANFKKTPKTNITLGQKAVVKVYSSGFIKLNGEVVEMLPEKTNSVGVKIKITQSIEKYTIKPSAKVTVEIKAN
ncbi:MAG: HlyD family secretion protein [Candidatus Gastranaerophilales bacterium]|nr:HlyD family secretion protein [Candidatus Gastranaerophilales bacterium]